MKNKYWQQVRGICIISVILIHTLYFTDGLAANCINIMIRRIFNFATALFIFIAGYFTDIKNVKEFYKKKFLRIMVPLIIWDLIYTTIVIVKNDLNISEIIKRIVLSNSAGHLYYLYVLMSLFLIAPMLIKYIEQTNNKKIQMMPLIITPIYNLFLTLYQIKVKSPFILYNYWIFGWISYYYLGLILKEKNQYLHYIKNEYLIISLLFSLVEGFLLYLKFNIYTAAISQLTITNSIYCILICALLVKKEKKIKEQNLLSKIGDYSFGMYLSHILILNILKKISNTITTNYFINVVLVFTSTIIITFLINEVYYKRRVI